MKQSFRTNHNEIKAAYATDWAKVEVVKQSPIYREVRFKGSIGHISVFVCDEFNHAIFSSVYAVEAVSLSREMLKLSSDFICLNWISDPKMFRDINRDPKTIKL